MILNQQRNLSFKAGLWELVEDHMRSYCQNHRKFSNWISILTIKEGVLYETFSSSCITQYENKNVTSSRVKSNIKI